MICDFTIYHHFQIARTLVPSIFDAHPAISDFMTAMENLPGMSDYLASRAQLTDVGTAPVLVQNGEVIQPGFE